MVESNQQHETTDLRFSVCLAWRNGPAASFNLNLPYTDWHLFRDHQEVWLPLHASLQCAPARHLVQRCRPQSHEVLHSLGEGPHRRLQHFRLVERGTSKILSHVSPGFSEGPL